MLFGLQGKSSIVAGIFLMTSLRDVHFEQRPVTFFPQAPQYSIFFRLLTLQKVPPNPNSQFPLTEPPHAFPTFPLTMRCGTNGAFLSPSREVRGAMKGLHLEGQTQGPDGLHLLSQGPGSGHTAFGTCPLVRLDDSFLPFMGKLLEPGIHTCSNMSLPPTQMLNSQCFGFWPSSSLKGHQ